LCFCRKCSPGCEEKVAPELQTEKPKDAKKNLVAPSATLCQGMLDGHMEHTEIDIIIRWRRLPHHSTLRLGKAQTTKAQ
jgi:hypothetical protein